MNTAFNKNKCINCPEYKRCRESFASWIFFLIAMISTIALRVITVLADIDPLYGKVAWYIGVGGFFIFFVYKYRVDQARHRMIVRAGLMSKISESGDIAREDRELIGSILCALSSNKDRINYFLIFASSAIAMLVAMYFDLLK